MGACNDCLRRTWLIGEMSGYLEPQRARVEHILELADEALIGLWRQRAAELESRYEQFGVFQAAFARAQAGEAGLELICRCESAYPQSLRRLRSAPAVLHVAGGMDRFLELADADPVAVVGTRQATSYGVEVAQMLGRGISTSGLTVVSGMAFGIDAAAHRGAVAGGGRTIAVLPGCPADPYPKQNQRLYREILRNGVAVSELGPGAPVRRWALLARNRIVAGLSRLTIVVQARPGSGALKTARFAKRLGYATGAVPGSVLLPQSHGPHELLRDGAVLVREPQDVLDAVFGEGMRDASRAERAALKPHQRAVLEAITAGAETLAALNRSAAAGDQLLATLAELELAGHIRRAAGGRYVPVL